MPRLPSPLNRLPTLAVLAVPLVVLLGAVAIMAMTHGSNKSGSSDASVASVPPTLAVVVSSPPVATATPAPVAVAPTPVPDPNRADCNQIRGSSYLSDSERNWFVANCSAVAGAATNAVAAVSSGDHLVIKKLGIDAPITVRNVGADGQMGDPNGPYDVVWYDFAGFGAGVGGYPGGGGNAVLAGHVDYHPNIEAVFWTLRQLGPGDSVDYMTTDGRDIKYVVQWTKEAGPDDDFTNYVAATGSDVMTLITCDGAFNPATRHYDSRHVVRATRVS